MTAAWIVQRPNEEPQAFDTEREAESRRSQLVASRTVQAATVYPIEVEPDVRAAGYWEQGGAA